MRNHQKLLSHPWSILSKVTELSVVCFDVVFFLLTRICMRLWCSVVRNVQCTNRTWAVKAGERVQLEFDMVNARQDSTILYDEKGFIFIVDSGNTR